MNINKIYKWINDVPKLKLSTVTSEIYVQDACANMALLNVLDPDTASSAQVVMMDLAMQLVASDDPVVVSKVWVEFLRDADFRRYVLALRHQPTSKPPKLPDACAKMRWSDELVYEMTYACKFLLSETRPDILTAPILAAAISCQDKFDLLHEGKISLDLKDRLQFVAHAVQQWQQELAQQEQPEQAPQPEPQPPEPVQEPVSSPEPAQEPVRPGIESIQELDNKQQLVKVRSRNGNVHYIVVDAGVDVMRAPQVWDLINRDELRLSVNVTTDRLARSKVINDYLAEGWTPSEVAELMEVPKHIVAGDIHLLRKLDRLGDTPGMRKRKRSQ